MGKNKSGVRVSSNRRLHSSWCKMKSGIQKNTFGKSGRTVFYEQFIWFAMAALLFHFFVPCPEGSVPRVSGAISESIDFADRTTDQTLCFLVETTPFMFVNASATRNLPSQVCWNVSFFMLHQTNFSVFSSASVLRLSLSALLLKMQMNRPLRI